MALFPNVAAAVVAATSHSDTMASTPHYVEAFCTAVSTSRKHLESRDSASLLDAGDDG